MERITNTADKRALLLALQRGTLRYTDIKELMHARELTQSISEIAEELRHLRDTDPDAFFAPPQPKVDELPITKPMRAAIIRILKAEEINPKDVEVLECWRLASGDYDTPASTMLEILEKLEDFEFDY